MCDQPRTPKCSPNATKAEVVSKILYLREQYHFGAGRIADYLKRFHQVAIARSSVHRIVGKHGMQRLPANQKHRPHTQRWQRYEKPQPGHRLQVDVKFLERIPGTRKRLYQFTAIDDCTRIRVLKIYDACNQRTADRSTERLLRLAFYSRDLMHELVRSHAIDFDYVQNGKLVVHTHRESFEAAKPPSPSASRKLRRCATCSCRRPFAPRCPLAIDLCRQQVPEFPAQWGTALICREQR